MAPKDDEDEIENHEKAIIIQCFIRCTMSRIRVKKKARITWKRIFDPSFDVYFWYNSINGSSQWDVPKYMELFNDRDLKSSIEIQKIIRSFLSKRKVKKLADSKWTRFFDAKQNRFYWMTNIDGKTFWNATPWLKKQEIRMNPEDVMLYDQYLKIKELEEKLLIKNDEIIKVRKLRYEELEPQVIIDRVKSAKNLERNKNMDTWTTDELAAFFVELKMDEYIEFIYQNRVDGLLFINLVDDDWTDMGIISRFHRRKLQLMLKSYRFRYQKKKEKVEIDEDDELLSEYSASELSDIIAQEDASDDDGFNIKNNGDDDTATYNSDEEAIEETLEQKQERIEDEKNIHIDLMVQGDNEHFPMIGDIVRMRYVCWAIKDDDNKKGDKGKPIASTKASMQRQSIEFVLGSNQIIKGIDRALPMMSIGERSKITITPEYAYGTTGLFPLIPPNSSVIFDITLLGFKARPGWVKPLIQEPNLSMRPYMDFDINQKVFGSQNDADDEKE